MIADILTIGDEILIGQVTDSNSAFIAEKLNQLGIKVRQILSVSDTEDAITGVVNSSIEHIDLLIMTGGLGPTNDDITKSALSKHFNSTLVRDQRALEKIGQYLKSRGISATERILSQADVPENCQVLQNSHGAVPGMLFKSNNGAVVISLPGVPYEMKAILTEEVIPWLKSNFTLPARLQKTFLVTGDSEAAVADRLEDFEKNMPDNASLAYLPSPGQLRIRLSITGKEQKSVEQQFVRYCSLLENELGENVFGYDNDTLESVIGSLLAEHSFTLSTAESCTGGNIAKQITGIPGASEYFIGSIVAYSNDIKKNILGVRSEELSQHGAVSKEVVVQMAEGVKKLMKTDFAIAVSGIAGPTGGTDEKPVGTVWIAIATPKSTKASKYWFGKHRGRTVVRATLEALNFLRIEIENVVKKTAKL